MDARIKSAHDNFLNFLYVSVANPLRASVVIVNLLRAFVFLWFKAAAPPA